MWRAGADLETRRYILASFSADCTRRKDKPWFQSLWLAWDRCSYVRDQLHGPDHARVHDGYRVAGHIQSGTKRFLASLYSRQAHLIILIVLILIVRGGILLIAIIVLVVIVSLRRALLNRRLAVLNTWLTVRVLVVRLRRLLLLILLRADLIALLAHIKPVLAHSSTVKPIRNYCNLYKTRWFKNDCSRVYSVLQGRFDSVTKRVSTKNWLN